MAANNTFVDFPRVAIAKVIQESAEILEPFGITHEDIPSFCAAKRCSHNPTSVHIYAGLTQTPFNEDALQKLTGFDSMTFGHQWHIGIITGYKDLDWTAPCKITLRLPTVKSALKR